jgi:hypothetical protein
VLRSGDLATISFPGRTSISFVDGENTPIALDLCTPASLLFYLIFIIFSVRQRHGASWAKQEMSFVPGGVVHFPKEVCDQCPIQAQCTTSAKGRSVSIHPDEALFIELRQLQQTPEGRAKLRERVAVEHTLAHVGWWQGRRARYRELRKNLFDLRRCAVVYNLHVLARSQQDQIAA